MLLIILLIGVSIAEREKILSIELIVFHWLLKGNTLLLFFSSEDGFFISSINGRNTIRGLLNDPVCCSVPMSNGFYFPWMPSISKCPSGMKHFLFFSSSSPLPKHKFPCHFTFSSQAISRSVRPRSHDIKINMQCQLQNKIAISGFCFLFFFFLRTPPLSIPPFLSLQDAEAKLENCVLRRKTFCLKCYTLYRTLLSTEYIFR